MSDFCGQNISDSYTNILNIGSGPGNCCLPASPSRCNVTDSTGLVSSLELGRSGAGICSKGPIYGDSFIQISGNGTIGGTLNAGITTLSQLTVTSNATVNVDASINGNLTVKADKLSVTSTCTKTSNNTCIGGTLNVCGNTAVDGCITATADIIAYSTSDKKFKDNLNKICNTKNIVNGLNGYSFEWNEQSGREGKDLGLIAQDVKEVLPEIVHTRDDGSLAVDYLKIIPVLVEEVKRLSAEVEQLKSI